MFAKEEDEVGIRYRGGIGGGVDEEEVEEK